MASFGLYWLLSVVLASIGAILLPFLWIFKHRHANWLRMRLFPTPLPDQPDLWIHSVSVGEVKIALSVHESLPKAMQAKVLFSATTPAGFEFLEKRLPTGCIGAMLPWDISFAYRKWFAGKKVPNLILVETELWPTLFRFVKNRGSALCIINARMSKKTLKWQRLGVLRKTVARLDLVAARSEADGKQFEACGLKPGRVRVTGNIKFDFKTPKISPGPLLQWLDMPGRTMIFASMASEEVGLLRSEVAWLLDRFPDLRILWAPRQVQDAPQHGEAFTHLKPAFRSTLSESGSRLLILDSMGELSGCYAYGTLSFVGGSFNKRGGQNFLESLQVGTPALVGPSTENFRHEVQEAIAADALLIVEDPAALRKAVVQLLEDKQRLCALADNAEAFLSRHAGAVARTVHVLVDSQW